MAFQLMKRRTFRPYLPDGLRNECDTEARSNEIRSRRDLGRLQANLRREACGMTGSDH